MRLSYAADGELLDAQRILAGRRREDVEESRQLHHDSRPAEGLARRGHSIYDAAKPLSAADQLDACRATRIAEESRPLVCTDGKRGTGLSLCRCARFPDG